MSRVTVLLTSYDAGEFLQQAVDSVLDQTFTDFELLILDDGSSDGRVQAAIDNALDDPRTLFCGFWPTPEERAETARYATLINRGAVFTTGQYIAHLCGDDFWTPDRLERMVAVLDSGEDVVYGSQRLLFEDGKTGQRLAVDRLTDAWCRVDLNSVVYRRTAFYAVGGWDDDPSLWRTADAAFWRKLTRAGFTFAPVPGDYTDTKRYRAQGVDARVIRGETPWVTA